MTELPADRRTTFAEAAAGAGLLLWRMLAVPLPALWRDWIALLSIYWIFTAFASRTRAWPYVTAGAMVLLTALYVRGQFPHTLDGLGDPIVIAGLLGMAVANAAMTLGALSITRRISSGRMSVDAVLFLMCRIVLISAVVLAAGLAKGLSPLVLGSVGAVGLAAWLVTGEHRRMAKIPWPDLGLPLWTAIAAIGVRLLAQVWLFSPYSVDPLSYHLPKVACWIQQGALFPFPGADVRETFPAGFELLETWWAVFLHHDVLIEMAGVEFLALGAAATAALARHAGLGLRASAFAAVLFALTPGLALQATACMNDGPVASVMLATLALAAVRCHPMLVLAAAALGVGVKPTFASVLPAVALLLALQRRTPFLPVQRRWAVSLAAPALVVGAFWYLCNAVRFGNPLYPVGSLATVDKAAPSGNPLLSLAARLNQLAGVAVYDEADHYTVQFILVAGWGAVTFACGGVALIAMARANPALRRLAAAFGVALLAALLIAPPGSFYLRFILFFPALAAIAVSALCEASPRLVPIAALGAALCFASSVKPGDLGRARLARLVRLGWQERVVESPLDIVPAGASVACLYGTHDDSNGESYLAYGPRFSRKVVFVSGADDLRKPGVSWVFTQARSGDGELRRQVQEAARAGRLRRAGRNLYEVVIPASERGR